MKQFKLNAFEKFVICHKKAIKVFLYAFLFLSAVITSICSNYVKIPPIDFVILTLTVVCLMYTEIMPAIKSDKVLKAYRNLNMEYALDGISALTDAVNPRDRALASLYHNNKTAFLIDAGNYEEAEKEIKLFFQIFDTRRLPPVTLFTIHVNLAQLKLLLGDEETYQAQLHIVEGYYGKVSKLKAKYFINFADNAFIGLVNSAFSLYGDYNEGFEQNVFNHMKFFGGKENKKLFPIDYLNAYSTLFTYFNRLGNTEKADYYARKVTKIGNSGYYMYRIAKEYLENADRSN